MRAFTAASPLGAGEAREELERFLERAERTDDPELADAVYAVAMERGERSVADAYLEKRPKEKRRWEEYVEARREANTLDRMFTRALTDRAMGLSEATG